MAVLRSQPLNPVPLQPLLLSVVGLWMAPVAVGLVGLLMAVLTGRTWAEFGLGVWFFANALTFSPLFSWVGWLIALPAVWAALRHGWFGWGGAALIGAAAGAIAGSLVDTEIALPFGIAALILLRAVLGRLLPL